MKIAVDTNVLVRAVVQDDRKQAEAAARLLRRAETIAVSVTCLCEFAWVLRRVYRFERDEIGTAIRALLDAKNVVVNRPAADAGLAMLESGGDFADGAIAWEGRWLGGETFVSFDREAVELMAGLGWAARLVQGS
jgi:predicted nucleic-acid-binding protein